ncbi:unnamed protein product [Aspergillus oryzae]|uniref:Unnamed protein product n=1 Tax=Aspergillus oryzae TaxID=5062 RepID=A0AAN4YTW1_ASPOZ|nr:unnamed protein product [Aspergillus oryzae]
MDYGVSVTRPLEMINVDGTGNEVKSKNGIQSSGPGIWSSPYGNEEYTIGWVSALPIEMAAAKGMLDEEHGDPQTPPQEADHNTYLLGAMSGFKVVIACLPKDELGASSAAVVATDMLFTFPNIRVGLMVGIGAGIPHYDDNETRDIRLGDVVIGSDRGSSGVVVYDFGKRLPDGSFENIYALDRPPRTLRTALAKMEAEHQTRENKICQYINSMLDKYPYMRKKGFAYPGSSYDQLFWDNYRHTGGRSCAGCDPAQRIHREDRFDTSPEIHYGIVATGSAVVKHAPTRAQIKQRHGAICLEMEAAGLINNFPCIVIRGISDYANSHKNDQWHSYAAATAAACAKELLGFVQPTALDAERKAKDVLQILNKGNDHFSRRQEGTGQWLLDSDPFQQWLEQSKTTLFCQGIPGAGKTIMASIVVNYLGIKFKDDCHVAVAYIFCNFRRQNEQTSTDLLTSLLKQLACQTPTLPKCLKNLFGNHKNQQTRPTSDEIWTALHTIGSSYEKVFIVIDALDECQSRFLLAKLHLDSLQDKISYSDVKNALRNLPKGVDAYEKAYSEAKGRIQGQMGGFRNLAMRILSWIVCSKRPVKTSELQHAIAVQIDTRELDRDNITDVGLMTSVCAGLVTVDKSSSIVRLVHYTAQEYFEKQWTSWFPDANTDIAVTCITYLSFDTFGSGICKTDDDFEKRLLLYPLYDFAAVFWAHHVRSSRVDMEELIAKLLKDGSKSSAVCQAIMVSGSSRHPNYSQKVPNDITGLHIAAQVGLVILSGTSWKGGYRVNDKDSHGRTPLSWAAAEGHSEVVKLLLSYKDTEADLKDKDGRTPLGWASLGGHKETAELLLAQGDVDPMTKVLHGQTPLIWASRNGHYDIVELLLNAEVDPDTEDKFNRTPLWWALRNGHHNTARLLLEAGADLDLEESNGQTLISRALNSKHNEVVMMLQERGLHHPRRPGQTALSRAAETSSLARVLLLLRKGQDPDNKDSDGRTPLSWAAQSGNISIMKLLLEAGANPTLKDDCGRTPILWAVKHSQVGAVRHLLGYGADHMDIDGRTPLSWAAQFGDNCLVNVLLDHGANLELQDNTGMSPLSWAVKNDQMSVISPLLKRGSNPNSSDTEGRTSLFWAVLNRQEEAILLLLEQGANPNCKDESSQTPLSLAVRCEQEAAVVTLLKYGADPNMKDDNNASPLLWATTYSQQNLVRLLLANGADPDIPDIHGQTPFMRAVVTAQQEIAEALLQHGANPNTEVTAYGTTALHWAASRRDESLIRLLLEKGADPNCADAVYGQTPLLWGVEHGQNQVILLLLEKGADPNVTDINGQTPMSWAEYRGLEDLVKVMAEYGATC